MVDDDVLDHDQNQKDDDADCIVPADHKLAECSDHVAGGLHSLTAVEQNQPRGCDVQRKPEQRGHQKDRRERRELNRIEQINRREKNDYRKRDVCRYEEIENDRRQRE